MGGMEMGDNGLRVGLEMNASTIPMVPPSSSHPSPFLSLPPHSSPFLSPRLPFQMLEVGNLAATGFVTEARAHFSLWCAAKAPLIIGTDVTNITAAALAILTNAEAIAVNQDPLGVQAAAVWSSAGTAVPGGSGKNGLPRVPKQSVWVGPLEGGAFAVVLFNAAEEAAPITLTQAMLGQGAALLTDHVGSGVAAGEDGAVVGVGAEVGAEVGVGAGLVMRDLWRKKSLGVFAGSFTATVAPHDVLFMTLRKE